jgi:putative heme-binding domain-containing protein
VFDGWIDRPLDVRCIAISAICSGLKQRGTTWDQAAKELDPVVAIEVADTFDSAKRRADDPVSGAESETVRALEFAPWEDGKTLLEIAKSHEQQSVRIQAIHVLGRRSEAEIGPALLADVAAQTPAIRAAILATMYGSAERTRLLLDEIAAGRVSAREIDPTRAGQLRNHRDAGIRERAQALLKDDTDVDRVKVLAAYNSVLSSKSDPKRGRDVFAKNCVQCHKVGDIGVNVAPDISDSRVKTAEQLLVSILDPNRAIDNNYFSYTVVDRDGIVHTGVIASETATSVTLRQPEGKEVTLLRSDIEELKSNGVSLMPVGLEKNISVEQMADLISFIKNWRYLDGSVPPEVIR